MKSVLNIRQRAQHCVQQKKKPSWTPFVYHFCYLCYSCYFCYKMKCLLFFSDFCYQMKCPGILKIFLPLFLFYMYYSCHTRCSKYTGTIWITLYPVPMWIDCEHRGKRANRIRQIAPIVFLYRTPPGDILYIMIVYDYLSIFLSLKYGTYLNNCQ